MLLFVIDAPFYSLPLRLYDTPMHTLLHFPFALPPPAPNAHTLLLFSPSSSLLPFLLHSPLVSPPVFLSPLPRSPSSSQSACPLAMGSLACLISVKQLAADPENAGAAVIESAGLNDIMRLDAAAVSALNLLPPLKVPFICMCMERASCSCVYVAPTQCVLTLFRHLLWRPTQLEPHFSTAIRTQCLRCFLHMLLPCEVLSSALSFFHPFNRVALPSPCQQKASGAGMKFSSLLGVLSQGCWSKCGTRVLKRWILQPLMDITELRARQDMVQLFVSDPVLRDELKGLVVCGKSVLYVFSKITGMRAGVSTTVVSACFLSSCFSFRML